MEFDVEVECPFCESVVYTTANFNPGEFCDSGGRSYLMKNSCGECGKDFWSYAQLRFELDVDEVFEKKPKDEE